MIPKADTGFRTRSCSGSELDHRPRARRSASPGFFDLQSGMGISVTSDTPTNGGQCVLELNGLSKSFGGLQAVRGITLKIMPGDRKAIIGPNGAGKTTLFNLITGIFPATSGQVLLFGRDVTSWASHRRTALGMARTFQITSLFPRLTVLDNVLLAIQGLRTSKFVMWRFLSSYRDVYAEGVRSAGTRRLHGSQGRRGSLPLAWGAAPARDRAGPRQRPEDFAAG